MKNSDEILPAGFYEIEEDEEFNDEEFDIDGLDPFELINAPYMPKFNKMSKKERIDKLLDCEIEVAAENEEIETLTGKLDKYQIDTLEKMLIPFDKLGEGKIPVLTDEEIEEQADKIIEFLTDIKPTLKNKSTKYCIEIRPLKRIQLNQYEKLALKELRDIKKSKEKYGANFLQTDEDKEREKRLRKLISKKRGDFIPSYKFWHLSKEKDRKYLIKLLKAINGKPADLYYSLYYFDYHAEVFKKDNTRFRKGKINNQNARTIDVLMMDFDDSTLEEFEEYRKLLLSVGVEIYAFRSGNGIQALILLDKEYEDTNLLKKFTQFMIRKGFKVDSAIEDAARIARLLYTFNQKQFLTKPLSVAKSLETKLICKTSKRYNVIDLFTKLNKLKDIIPGTLEEEIELQIAQERALYKDKIETLESELKKVKNSKEITTTKEKKEKVNLTIEDSYLIQQGKVDHLAEYREVLKDVDFDLDAIYDEIKDLLKGVKQDRRNKALIRIVTFFKDKTPYTLDDVQKIAEIWANRCVPIYEPEGSMVLLEDEVERFYTNFSFIETEENPLMRLRDIDKIEINNYFFETALKNLDTEASFEVYIKILIWEVENQKQMYYWTREDFMEKLEITEKVFKSAIKPLLKTKLICIKKGNKRLKEKDLYFINSHIPCKTRTEFNLRAVENLINRKYDRRKSKRLTITEMKIIMFFKWRIKNKEKSCWSYQGVIATELGLQLRIVQQRISDLEKKKFLIKEEMPKHLWKPQNDKALLYTLLF